MPIIIQGNTENITINYATQYAVLHLRANESWRNKELTSGKCLHRKRCSRSLSQGGRPLLSRKQQININLHISVIIPMQGVRSCSLGTPRPG